MACRVHLSRIAARCRRIKAVLARAASVLGAVDFPRCHHHLPELHQVRVIGTRIVYILVFVIRVIGLAVALLHTFV